MFPSGHVLGTPRSRSTLNLRRSHTVVKQHQGFSNDKHGKETENNLSFPRLDSSILPVNRKRPSCSFVNNQRVYLRMKGYNVDDVYSLKRHRRKQPNLPDRDQLLNRHITNLDFSSLPILNKDVPKTINKAHRGFTSQKKCPEFWKPVNSRHPSEHSWQTLYSILNTSKEALHPSEHVTSQSRDNDRIPGYVTSRSRDQRNGGMTSLNQRSYNKDRSAVVSPMTGRHSNMLWYVFLETNTSVRIFSYFLGLSEISCM